MATYIAGKYDGTYDGTTIGELAEGWRLSHSRFSRIITGHSGAKTPQDGIHQGGEMFLSMTCIEAYLTKVKLAFWPLSSTLFDLGVIGRLDSAMAKQVIMTALAATPAAASPATITFPLTILAEGYPVEMLFGPDLREVPLRLRLYPNSSNVFGSVT